MPLYRFSRVTFSGLFLFALASTLLHAQNPSFVLDHVTGFSSLPSSLEVQSGDAREQITALRDDLLRIRIAPDGKMPEDASWAVSVENRHSSVPVTPVVSSTSVGFRTRALIVEIQRKTLRLTVTDLAGNIVQQDALPVHYDGAAFRVYKYMPLDEHYFGLGDKTGPLDRPNEAFTLWNTDAYRFQESTDPIYKSIPFFMTYKS